MSPFEIIDDFKYKYAEWIEHSSDPEKMLAFILAQQINKLTSHVEYLERRIEACQR